MSKQAGYDKGYRDAKESQPCLVRKVRGKLVWQAPEGDSSWAEGYIDGYTQGCLEDSGDIPLAAKERLRA